MHGSGHSPLKVKENRENQSPEQGAESHKIVPNNITNRRCGNESRAASRTQSQQQLPPEDSRIYALSLNQRNDYCILGNPFEYVYHNLL